MTVALALLCMLVSLPGRATEEISREYRIKAAFIYNLVRFIHWPGEKESTEGSEPTPAESAGEPPWSICIYGYNPFDRYMQKLEERTVRGRAMKVRYIGEKETSEGCHLLFISRHNTTQPALLQQPEPYPPVLTVSDSDDFLTHGMVALVTAGNNVQLDINLTRARKAGFNISANLLEMARRRE